MYVITGASGNIGGEIARRLLQLGKKVRAIARDEKRLTSLVDRGAEVRSGSLDDAEFLKKAMEGATAAFTMIPSDVLAENYSAYQDRIGEAIFTALNHSRVPYVVNLSSLGAHLSSGTGPIAGLHRQEQRLNRLDANVLHLRPTFFMENFLGNIPMIREMGIFGSSLKPDLLIPFVATRDVGAVGAERLNRLDFKGTTLLELLGQRDIQMVEATKIIGEVIGKPDLPYVHFSYEDEEKGIIQAGLSTDVAKQFVEINRAFNEGLIVPPSRTAENTTPTSIEEFAAQVFAAVYKS